MTTKADKPESPNPWLWQELQERYGLTVTSDLRRHAKPLRELWPELERRYGTDVANELHDGWKLRMARHQRWRARLNTPLGIDDPIPPKPRYGPRIREIEQQQRDAAFNAMIEEMARQSHTDARYWMKGILELCALHDDGTATLPAHVVDVLAGLSHYDLAHMKPAEQSLFRSRAEAMVKVFMKHKHVWKHYFCGATEPST